MLNAEICDRARLARDARFDGRFVTGVLTMRIYCRPICPVRPAKSMHVCFFPSAAAAERAGFRPCVRCRPEAAPGTPAWHGSGVELGIRDMSFVHAAAATRSCTIPSDTLCYMRQSDLLTTPFRVEKGFIAVPDAPGLGVTLDEAAVKRYRVG